MEAGPWCSRHAIYLTLLPAEGKGKEKQYAYLPNVFITTAPPTMAISCKIAFL